MPLALSPTHRSLPSHPSRLLPTTSLDLFLHPSAHPPSLAHIRANDVVELWCCGANVPGAWLESRVKRVRNGRYCVGKVRVQALYMVM